jgi:hypothetical protein
MKKRFFNQIILVPTFFVVVMLTTITSRLWGQVQLCENAAYQIVATGTGCSKAEAKLAMREMAAGLAVAVCPDKVCQQDTVSPCVLKLITAVTGVGYVQQNNDTCPPPHLKWTATRTYSVTCKCINVPQPHREDVLVPNDSEWEGTLSVFPNPSAEQVFVDVSPFEGAVRFDVINMLGQQVLNQEVNVDGLETFTIDISSFAPGIYKMILAKDSNLAVGTFVRKSE